MMDKGLRAKLSHVIETVDMYYDKYEFGEVAKVLYHFIWDIYANTYIEYAKVELKKDDRKDTVSYILRETLISLLKLMHPFVPFVTDRMYEVLTQKDDLMISNWPKSSIQDDQAIHDFDMIDQLITKFRNQRAETQVFKPLDVIMTANQDVLDVLKTHDDYIKASIKASHISYMVSLEDVDAYIPIPSLDIIGYVLREDMIDPEKERQLLETQKVSLEKELERSQKLLSNDNFLKKASPEKIQSEKEKQASYQMQYDAIMKKLS